MLDPMSANNVQAMPKGQPTAPDRMRRIDSKTTSTMATMRACFHRPLQKKFGMESDASVVIVATGVPIAVSIRRSFSRALPGVQKEGASRFLGRLRRDRRFARPTGTYLCKIRAMTHDEHSVSLRNVPHYEASLVQDSSARCASFRTVPRGSLYCNVYGDYCTTILGVGLRVHAYGYILQQYSKCDKQNAIDTRLNGDGRDGIRV